MLDLEKQVIHQIEKSENILLVFPVDSDSDHNRKGSLAASLALYLFLSDSGKKVCLASSSNNAGDSELSFLPGFAKIRNSLENGRDLIVSVNIQGIKLHKIRYTLENDRVDFIVSPESGSLNPQKVSARTGKLKYDLVICVGARNLESLGEIYSNNIEFFYEAPIINIDCQASNEDFGQINDVDLSAVSAAEIVFSIIKNSGLAEINPDIATCLLAGIMQQTNNFKNAKLTPRTLLTTSELIDCGARREEIINSLYRRHDTASLKIWAEVLNSLQTDTERGLAWAEIGTMAGYAESVPESQISHLIEELIATVPSIKLVAIFRELTESGTSAWLYSLKNIDALHALDKYRPQGNKQLATIFLPLSPDKASTEVVSSLQAYLDKLTS